MIFCDECGSMMKKTAKADGTILFVCNCQLTKDGGPDDTLMAEGSMKTGNDQTHEVFMSQAAFDPAGNKIMDDCPKCGIDYMTMFQVGENMTTMYTCECGYLTSHSEHMADKSRAKK